MNKVNSLNKDAFIITQFIVYTNEDYLYKLLNTLKQHNLDISAYYISEDNQKIKFVFIINEEDNQSFDNANITRNILKQNKYKFDETKVVKLYTNDNVDLLAYHYSELIKTLTVFNSYLGKDGFIVYETCCPSKTLKVLNELS